MVKVRKQNCGGLRHNLSENQVSTWKRKPFLENAETFFESPEKHSDASSERIAQLEQIVGRLTLALEIECDQVWVGDITYVRLKHRFIYVALLMDVFTRMIRGWKLSQHLTQALTLKPLEQALHGRVAEIHHSDQGVQYLSSAYLSTLKAHGIEISVARRGCPWENGYAERLIRTLKKEEVYLNDYENLSDVQAHIGYFLQQVYNEKRPHLALGYLTPLEFQRQTFS